MITLFIHDIGFGKDIRALTFCASNNNVIADGQCHEVLGDQHVTVIVREAE